MGEARAAGAGERSRSNGAAIESEIAWFGHVLERRLATYLGGGDAASQDWLAAPPPADSDTPYGANAGKLEDTERLVLILALLPILRPEALDPFFIVNQSLSRPFTEFGGAPAGIRTGFQPTRQTALFLLAGDMDSRLAAMALFDPAGRLHSEGYLELPADTAEPGPWTPLIVGQAWSERLTGVGNG